MTNKEAIKFLKEPRMWEWLNVAQQIAIDMAIDALSQEPKTGHWIYEKRKRLINETDEGAEYVTDYWCKCSKCSGDFGYRKMKDAFCKYCGAKMQEEGENGDK